MSAALWLLGVPVVGTPLVYLGGRLGRQVMNSSAAARWMSLGILGLLWLAFLLALNVSQPSSVIPGLFSQLDGLGLLLTFVVLLIGSAALICSVWFMRDSAGEEYFYASLLAMMGAMIGISLASDLFVLWIWFELLGLASYFLVAFYQDHALAAGMRYLVQGALGSALILLGIALIFAQTGTLALDQFSSGLSSVPMTVVAGALLVIGFGVKIAVVPLHTWLADAHSQAPAGVSALLSGVVLAAALVALLRVLAPLLSTSDVWAAVFLTLGAMNMLAGNLLALRQSQVKRMLAYSSISHMGYILLGVGISMYVGSLAGAQGAFFHVLNHGLMKALAFLAVGALASAAGVHSLQMEELSGGLRRFPLASLCLIVALLGLGGVPLLAGFMSKWQIFLAGFMSQNVWIIGLVIFAALNSVLSLAYYAPVVSALVRRGVSSSMEKANPIPASVLLVLCGLALMIVLLGIAPDLVANLTQAAASVFVVSMSS